VDEQLTTGTELIEESKVARGVGKGQLWLILGILAAITVAEYLLPTLTPPTVSAWRCSWRWAYT